MEGAKQKGSMASGDGLSIKSGMSAQESIQKKHSKKRKKRQRGQKAKFRVVPGVGEGPRERQIAKGKVRQLDILRGDPSDAKLPRKTREFLSLMRKFNGDKPPRDTVMAKPTESSAKGAPKSDSNSSCTQETAKMKEDESGKVNDQHTSSDSKQTGKKGRFEGMQPGENFAQFSARLRKESRQMMIKTARSGNHQREKKRAYYEKRKERALRRKRRKRGELSDSDVEEGADHDWDESNSIAHLPSYWQEIVHNNGRPISAKQKKRLQRREKAMDKVEFGERVERPPEFSALPVRRGRKGST